MSKKIMLAINEPGEKIIAIEWQPEGAPTTAFNFYHEACYEQCKVIFPDGNITEITREDIPLYTTCSNCGWYLKF